MKNLKIKILAILAVLLFGITQAATFNLGWDANPPLDAVTGYKLYSLVGTNQNFLKAVSANISSVTLPDGIFKLSVTATNIAGESSLSNPLYIVISGTNVVSVSLVPGAPTNIQIK